MRKGGGLRIDVFPAFCFEFSRERAHKSLLMHLCALLMQGVQGGGGLHIDVFTTFRSNRTILKPLEVNETEKRLVRGPLIGSQCMENVAVQPPPLHTSWGLSRGQDDQFQLTSQMSSKLTLKITTTFTTFMIMITIMTMLMSMMTTRGSMMLMMLLMMMMIMMHWQVKITMACTHACASAHVLCIKMFAIEAH